MATFSSMPTLYCLYCNLNKQLMAARAPKASFNHRMQLPVTAGQ